MDEEGRPQAPRKSDLLRRPDQRPRRIRGDRRLSGHDGGADEGQKIAPARDVGRPGGRHDAGQRDGAVADGLLDGDEQTEIHDVFGIDAFVHMRSPNAEFQRGLTESRTANPARYGGTVSLAASETTRRLSLA